MGCDIHLYIEYKDPSENKEWPWSCFGGRINPGRDYHLFTAMAGVRNYNREALFQPRGLPNGISYSARDDNQLYVEEEETGREGIVTREKAEKWISQGISSYTNDRKYFVSHPDWHTHSWLSPDELEKCINSLHDVSIEYTAVLAVLRCFERQGKQARVVFWFDN